MGEDSVREELNRVKHEYEQLREEHAAIIGHHNSKQRIQYVLSLKRQIADLMEKSAATNKASSTSSFAQSKSSSRMK